MAKTIRIAQSYIRLSYCAFFGLTGGWLAPTAGCCLAEATSRSMFGSCTRSAGQLPRQQA